MIDPRKNDAQPLSHKSVDSTSSAGSCWALTEGAAGMVSQVRGLAQAVGLPYEVKTVMMRFPWKKLWPGVTPLRDSIFTDSDWLNSDSRPRLVISSGRQGMMGSLLLKKQLGDRVFTVHTQDPKINSARFDLVVAPEHDGFSGPNVICTRGALHPVNDAVLLAAAKSSAAGQLGKLRPQFAAVLLGGPNNCYEFTPESLAPLVESLHQAIAGRPLDLVVLPSRRTPASVVKLFQDAFGQDHLVWSGTGENPYMAALALCTHVIVTGDSVSMVSEGAATEKPVYVYHLPEKRVSRRFRRFHADFCENGITRPFLGRLDDWSYLSPNPTRQIADVVIARLGLTPSHNSRFAA